jgi:hypothetical protein
MQRAGVRVADDCDARTAQKINHLVKHRLRIEGHRTTMKGECVALPAQITPECAANGRTAGLVDEETALLAAIRRRALRSLGCFGKPARRDHVERNPARTNDQQAARGD